MKTDLRKTYKTAPNAVQMAGTILWACFGIGLLNTLFVVPHPSPVLPGTYVMGFLVFGLEALVIAAIGRGRNWARIMLLMFCIRGFVSVILMMHVLIRLNGELPVLIVLAEDILQAVALLLLFQREATEWFRGGRPSELTPRERMRARTPYSYPRYQ